MHSLEKEDFNDNQLKILQLLLEKSYIQKDLQTELGISSPGLLYHLNKMEDLNLIQKKTIQQIGNAKINEISLKPLQLQTIRRLLDMKIEKCTLFTGFGELEQGYRIPDIGYKLLQNEYQIDEIVCITTEKGKAIREEHQAEEKLLEISRYHFAKDYHEFKYRKSPFLQSIDSILIEEMKNSDLILDLTPWSKLYSFELLKRANKYNLNCYYLGMDEEGEDSLIWMTDVKIKGEYKKKGKNS